MDLKGLEALQPVSCLSPNVKHIICNMDKQVLGVADPNCLTLDGFINWKEMEEILLPSMSYCFYTYPTHGFNKD